MTITLNGDSREVDDGISLSALLELLSVKPETIAIECNGTIIRRGAYNDKHLNAGDKLEVIQFYPGG